MPLVTRRIESIQYTGANGAAVAAWVAGCNIVSDNGTTLVVYVPDYGDLSFTANDHWLLRGFGHGFTGHLTNTEYGDYFVELS